jgi:heme a synthase
VIFLTKSNNESTNEMSASEHSIVGLITLAIIIGLFLWIGRNHARYRQVLWGLTAATFVLVVLGAYVRLSDAGLGCPDWPGCYGNLTPAHSKDVIIAAQEASPHGPVSMPKAWKEMIHRYLAMLVGAGIAAVMFAAWRNRRAFKQSPLHATVLAFSVIWQAALGAWTVTMLLKPAIVTSHLLGGMTVLALLAWLSLRQSSASGDFAIYKGKASPTHDAPVKTAWLQRLAFMALAVVIAQIALGGWVSTNYAALACTDFPTCNGKLMPDNLNFADAFHVLRPLGMTAKGELLSMDSLRAIHWLHRVGAVIVTLVLLAFAWQLWQAKRRAEGIAVISVLSLQVFIGIGNVVWSLPLPLAAAHNAGAAALLLCMLWVTRRVHGSP